MIIRPVRRFTAAIIALAVWSTHGSAQGPAQPSVVVRGTVAEALTGVPMASVSLQLLDATGESRSLGITDGSGRFRLTAPERGTYRVRATRIGFLKFESPLVRVDTAEVFVVVEMVRGTILDSVFITAAELPIRPTQQLIRGRLLDDDSGEPLDNGTIELFDSRDRSIATATTNRDGYFRLVTPAPGTYSMLGRHIGHRPAHQKDFRFRLGDTVRLEFRLARNAVLLAPALVTASARPWRERGDRLGLDDLNARIQRYDGRQHARFILRDTIEAYDRRQLDVAYMLGRILRTSPTNLSGCSGGKVAVDNVLWPMSPDAPNALDMYPLSTIELIEHYQFPDIPSEFAAPVVNAGMRTTGRPPCTVLSLWTRLGPKRPK